MLVHIKAIPQQMRLMAPPLPQALKLRLVEVILQNRHVVGMRALLDDDSGTFLGRQTTHIGKTLLRDDDVEVVLGLADVCAHGHDARDTGGVGLGGAGGWRVHD